MSNPMSKTETVGHTPGPWRVSVGLNAGYIASESHGFVPIRTPFRPDAFKDGPDRSDHSEAELEANARLIAASPRTLAALRGLVALIERDYSGFDAIEEWQEANAAIREATGADA
jgi:hypothetical protein